MTTLDYVLGENGCWNSTACPGSSRPQVYYDGWQQYAYRVSYQVHVGPIPPGAMICHHCDNPRCINPAHLYAGSAADNGRDASARGRARTTPRYGADHHLTTLTTEQVLEVCDRYARGDATQAQLAREYGMTQTGIGHLVRGETWTEVPRPLTTRGKGAGPELRPHGTHAAYERHRRAGEPPCDECVKSNRADCRERSQKRRDALEAVA